MDMGARVPGPTHTKHESAHVLQHLQAFAQAVLSAHSALLQLLGQLKPDLPSHVISPSP